MRIRTIHGGPTGVVSCDANPRSVVRLAFRWRWSCQDFAEVPRVVYRGFAATRKAFDVPLPFASPPPAH